MSTPMLELIGLTKHFPVRNGFGRQTGVVKAVDTLRQQTDALAALLEVHASSTEKHAKHMRDKVVPAMVALRETGDALELMVPHETWPLPTYREMLFIK